MRCSASSTSDALYRMLIGELIDHEDNSTCQTARQVPLVGKYTIRWARWDGAEASAPPLQQEEHAAYVEVRRWSVRVIAGSYAVAATAVTLSASHVQVGGGFTAAGDRPAGVFFAPPARSHRHSLLLVVAGPA